MTIRMTLALTALVSVASGQDYKTGIEWQEPPIVTPGETNSAPPSDAIVLFDGTDMSAWDGGEWIVKDGVATVAKGGITSKQSFGDMQLHLEWSAPTEVKGQSQGRGNSGVFLMGRYEVQILDSYDNQTYFDGQAASVYKQTPPMANAMRKPGEWNTYDIFWTAPKFGTDGQVEEPACVTVVHNGVLALNHFKLLGPTNFSGPAAYEVHDPKGPISIQDHGNPVRFRNIWVRELKPAVGQRVSSPYFNIGGKKVDPAQLANEKEANRMQKAIERRVKEELKKIKQAEAAAKKANEEKEKAEKAKAQAEAQAAAAKAAADSPAEPSKDDK